jgi:hypothetical protein
MDWPYPGRAQVPKEDVARMVDDLDSTVEEMQVFDYARRRGEL